MKRAKDLCGTRPVMMKKLNISLIKKPSYIENVAALKLETQKAWQKGKEKFSIVEAYIDARAEKYYVAATERFGEQY